MRKLLLFPILLAVGLTACQTVTKASNPQGLEKYGYPYVLKVIHFQPGQAVSVTLPDAYAVGAPAGRATFTIPPDAFSVPVTFEILAGSNSAWDSKVASGLKVVANFAYLVTETATGAPVTKFDRPVLYSVNDSMITGDSVYWATSPTTPPKLFDANAASRISGTTLEHPTTVATVGWIITTPRSELAATSTAMKGWTGSVMSGSSLPTMKY